MLPPASRMGRIGVARLDWCLRMLSNARSRAALAP